MKYIVKIKSKTPLLIGSNESSEIYNKTFAKSYSEPFVPGSSFKGALREVSNMFEDIKKEIIDTLLGTSKKEGILNFTSFYLDDETKFKTIERTHTSLDRKTRSVKMGHLFNANAVESGYKYIGYIYSKRSLTKEEEDFLNFLIENTKKIGGMKSVGYGFINVEIQKVNEESLKNTSLEGKTYLLSLSPMEPYMCSKERVKTYLYDSSTFVPGSTLRGAYSVYYDKNSNEFKEIFLKEKVKFPWLYPCDEGNFSFPAPPTYMIEKYSEESSLYDSLIEYILVNDLNTEENKFYGLKSTNDKNKRLENYSGYLNDNCKKINIENSNYSSTQVALDKKTRSAIDGSLRTYSTRNYKTIKLKGILRTEKEDLIGKLINQKLFIGGSKTRGFGLMKVDEITPFIPSFEKDIISFNKKVAEYKKQLNMLESEDLYIPIILISDLILKDNSILNNIFGKDFDLTTSLLSYDTFSGWNAASNIKKPLFKTIKRGSVIVYKTGLNAEQSSEILMNKFISGIGSMTGSGFGSFIVYKTID